jgi:hypothetical protein
LKSLSCISKKKEKKKKKKGKNRRDTETLKEVDFKCQPAIVTVAELPKGISSGGVGILTM